MLLSSTLLRAFARCLLIAIAFSSLCIANSTQSSGAQVILKNERIQRCLQKEGEIWKTVWISRADGTDKQVLNSDELRIRLFDGTELSLRDYRSTVPPKVTDDRVIIQYEKREQTHTSAPSRIAIDYYASPEGLRKTLTLEGVAERTIDILEVERFSTSLHATHGGRGQPVFLADRWFVGLEHPAGHSRHTDGNSPLADSSCFELVGNYSFVDLDGADIDPSPREGLVRLFHFPIARPNSSMRSQTAILGFVPEGLSPEQAFYQYLDRIAKRPRSFTHYNNWFDAAGKNLNSQSFTQIARAFTEALQPYGIKLDAMVPDNGWQDRRTIWQPSRSQFPAGMNDLEKLGRSLQAAESSLGLWLSLDSTTCDIPWGESEGFVRAKPNQYFAQYFPHYAMSHEKYKNALKTQLSELIRRGRLTYFKHDFNHLSDLGEHSGHPGTDRHGHEAEVDAMLELLEHCRQVSPDIYQNLTNWVWFSPWWLMHGDALWMLAGDDGFNKNTPELSARAMATTDRDTYLWRMWGQSGCRPLVPISRLMTHGIIRNPSGQMESPQDTLLDWADHVMMYYGRGVQMKEWYITPSAMSPEHWKVLGSIHAWSDHHFNALRNVVYVGGRPDEGNVYGYFGWSEQGGILTTRNPSPRPQTLRIPIESTSFLRSPIPPVTETAAFETRVVYPYLDQYGTFPATTESLAFEIPGYSTMTFEITLKAVESVPSTQMTKQPLEPFQLADGEFKLPNEPLGRCEIMVIGYPFAPRLKINETPQSPHRTAQGVINQFASYARAGMESDSARMWSMAAYDVSKHRGQSVRFNIDGFSFDEGTYEIWLLAERPVKLQANTNTPQSHPLPWAIQNAFRRETYPLVPERRLPSVSRRSLTNQELESITKATLVIESFGVDGGSFGEKQILLNGEVVGHLPTGGDSWQRMMIELPPATLKNLTNQNVLTIQHNGRPDKFKFRGGRLVVQTREGQQVSSSMQEEAQTSFGDWPHAEGKIFAGNSSTAVVLDFLAN